MNRMAQVTAAVVLLFLGIFLATPLGIWGFCMVSFTDPNDRAMGWLLLVGGVVVAAVLFWGANWLFRRARDTPDDGNPRVRIKNRTQNMRASPHEPQNQAPNQQADESDPPPR